MLIISEKDICSVIEPKEVVRAIEQSYKVQENRSAIIPERMHVDNEENTLLLMPGFSKEIMGTKLVSVFPQNAKLKKPAIFGQMILNDINTGEPLALINGNKLTAVRTGAVGATAIKYLSKPNDTVLGVIGAGVQGLHQISMSLGIHTFQQIKVFDNNINNVNVLISSVQSAYPNVDIIICESANQLVLTSDIVITTTSSSEPVFDVNANAIKHKLFIAIGSYKPTMQEIHPNIIANADSIFIDTPTALQESGDILLPIKSGLVDKDKIQLFHKIINTNNLVNLGDIRIFKSVGIALFDLFVAEYIYTKCKSNNIGTQVSL